MFRQPRSLSVTDEFATPKAAENIVTIVTIVT
jgi:hypothetical protein